jgi:hypothetical protein
LVDGPVFELISCILVIANAFVLGLQQDRCMRALQMDSDSCSDILPGTNAAFVLLFLVEVGLRILAKRWSYFTGQMWKWNMFDILLAVLGVLDLILQSLDIPYARLLRFFRLVRLLRVMRTLRWLRDLRHMASTLMQSMVSLGWAFVLLGAVMFFFGVCFLQGVAAHLEGHDRSAPGWDNEHGHLKESYGSIPKVLYTLLLATTNGADWKELAEPLAHISPVYQALFGVYVVIVLVGALNVLTSVFVERARELSMLDRDMATQIELASQEAFIMEMQRVFDEVDNSKDGMITWQKFMNYLQNESAQAFFETQQLDTSDAAGLFSLLDEEDKGEITIEAFALGCMKLRGQAKSSEVAKLAREGRKRSDKVMKELQALKSQIDGMQGAKPRPRRPSDRSRTPSAAARSRKASEV